MNRECDTCHYNGHQKNQGDTEAILPLIHAERKEMIDKTIFVKKREFFFFCAQ